MSTLHKDWLPWFPCNPAKLLGSLASMSADEKLVYVIVLLRIYEVGGPINDDVHALMNRTGLKPKRVDDALARLFATQKLIKIDDEPGFYTNPFAQDEIADQIKRAKLESGLQSTRRRNGIKNKNKVEENQQTDVTAGQPTVTEGDPPVTHLHEHRHIQSTSLRSVDRRGSRLPDDWQPSDDETAYAKDHGLIDGDLRNEIEKFRNHWHAKSGKDASKVDWNKTWNNWILKWVEYNGNKSRNGRTSAGTFAGRPDPVMAGLAKRYDQLFGDGQSTRPGNRDAGQSVRAR
jgi:hypothetical protein